MKSAVQKNVKNVPSLVNVKTKITTIINKIANDDFYVSNNYHGVVSSDGDEKAINFNNEYN